MGWAKVALRKRSDTPGTGTCNTKVRLLFPLGFMFFAGGLVLQKYTISKYIADQSVSLCNVPIY